VLLTLLGALLSALGLIVVFVGIVFVPSLPWNAVVTHFGSVLVGAGVVEIVIHHYASKQLVKDVTERILKAMKFPIAAFYQDREALDSLSDELKGVGQLWVAWHTGTVALTKTFFSQSRGGRAILTHPGSNQIKELDKVGGKAAEGMVQDIKAITTALQKQRVDVRWFDGPIGNSIIIADPNSDKSWMRIELLVPNVVVESRPSFRVEKSSSKKLFDTFYDSYVKMWDASKTPSKGELDVKQ
jgi:hypothetical protein